MHYNVPWYIVPGTVKYKDKKKKKVKNDAKLIFEKSKFRGLTALLSSHLHTLDQTPDHQSNSRRRS